MAKVVCPCGETIYDQSDRIHEKAHVVADMDWPDYIESIEQGLYDAMRCEMDLFQCPHCGRLIFSDPRRNRWYTFSPDTPATPKRILETAHGENYARSLNALFRTLDEEEIKIGYDPGFISCYGMNEGGAQGYKDWRSMEKAYYQLFEKYKGLGVLKDAHLMRDSETIHRWKG